jgi:hypothetical protein
MDSCLYKVGNHTLNPTTVYITSEALTQFEIIHKPWDRQYAKMQIMLLFTYVSLIKFVNKNVGKIQYSISFSEICCF